ncbi:MAG TPA: YihY/virulence factor BrkB family protein [Actinomycetota bacterium]
MPDAPEAPRGWRALPTLAVRTVRDSFQDRIFGLGAEVAFFFLLSFPPALLTILGTLGYVSQVLGEDVAAAMRDQILSVAGSFLTQETVTETVRPLVNRLLAEGRADVASFGIVLTLWAASRATTRLIEAVAIAYDEEDERSAVRRRLLSLGMTVGTIVALVLVIPILVAGPRLLEALAEPLGLTAAVAAGWQVLYWPVVGVIGIGLLSLFYHLASPLETRWRRDVPGAFAAAGVWLLGGLGLRVYLSFSLDSGAYGPLAAPIAVLLWMYVTALAVLLGAEVNAEIEKMWPDRPRKKRDA